MMRLTGSRLSTTKLTSPRRTCFQIENIITESKLLESARNINLNAQMSRMTKVPSDWFSTPAGEIFT